MVFCRKVCQSILIIALFCSGQLAAQTFTYSYSNLFDGELDRASGFTEFEMLRAVEESLALWASVTPLNFVEQPDSGPPVSDNPYPAASHPDIRIGHHELSGSTLAHAYFPGGGGLDSDLHMDSSNRTWRESTFFTTMAHELGHTIGIGHIDDAVAIMNSSIKRWLSSRVRGSIAATWPSSPIEICNSARSRSSVPRLSRPRIRASYAP